MSTDIKRRGSSLGTVRFFLAVYVTLEHTQRKCPDKSKEVEPPQKRPRGRPRKEANVPTPIPEVNSSNVTAEPPATGRGGRVILRGGKSSWVGGKGGGRATFDASRGTFAAGRAAAGVTRGRGASGRGRGGGARGGRTTVRGVGVLISDDGTSVTQHFGTRRTGVISNDHIGTQQSQASCSNSNVFSQP